VSLVHGWFLSDLYVCVVIFCHNFNVKLLSDNIPRVYCLKSFGSIFKSEIRCLKIDIFKHRGASAMQHI
jgi:hypothetical protein